MILEITGWRRSSSGIILYCISDPFPKKSDNSSENYRKTSGDLGDTEKALVTTTETVFKEGSSRLDEHLGMEPLSTMSVFPSLTTVSVLVTNACLVSSKYPPVFPTFSLSVSDSLGYG